jgi:serine/threonine protein kinase
MLQPTEDPTDPLAGETFGKYVLLKRLAVGGMAEVYLANLLGAAGFSKLVVIKLVLPNYASDAKFVDMFLDEGRLAARLSHPNIAQTFDLGEADGRYYIAMEYVMGETLSALIRRITAGERMPMGIAVRICTQLLEALDYAHEATDERGQPLGIVHRDVTPSNVLVTYHGGVKLVDFGIARAATQQHETQVGVVRGKVGFMAPEQCTVLPVDRRADIFNAGSILYALMVGQEPYPRYSSLKEGIMAMREARFAAPKQVRPDLPEALDAIILKAMQLAPGDRYQTAGAMLADLERAAAALAPAATTRELADYTRRLFPDKENLARLAEDQVDTKTVVELLSVSDGDILPLEPTDSPLDVAVRATKPMRQHQEPAPLADTTAGAVPASAPQRSWPRAAVWGSVGGLAVFALGAVWLGSRSPASSPPPPAVPLNVARPVPPPEVTVALVPPAPAPVVPAVVEPAPKPASRSAKGPASRPPKPARVTGWLKIDTYPWAHVRDGTEDLGVTPLRVELTAGKHHILLENEQLHLKRSVWVVIKPGEETRSSTGLDQLPP